MATRLTYLVLTQAALGCVHLLPAGIPFAKHPHCYRPPGSSVPLRELQNYSGWKTPPGSPTHPTVSADPTPQCHIPTALEHLQGWDPPTPWAVTIPVCSFPSSTCPSLVPCEADSPHPLMNLHSCVLGCSMASCRPPAPEHCPQCVGTVLD